MEDFPILLVFLLFYLFAGSSGKKKKNRRMAQGNAGPIRTRAQGEQHDRKAVQRDKQTLEGFGSAFEQTTLHDRIACEGERIHLDEVTQADMQRAAEGEDPCHGGNSAAHLEFESVPEEDEALQGLRADMLRGVVMNEILMRPHERRAVQRSKRYYHG